MKCRACVGAGLMTYKGTVSSVVSCFFISGTGTETGGGLYHDGAGTSDSIYISDSFFATNTACSDDNRGGGAFEDFRSYDYSSRYSFSFFTGNVAENGQGNDIAIEYISLSSDALKYCVTTSDNSLWNVNGHPNHWLPHAHINANLTATVPGDRNTVVFLSTDVSIIKTLLYHTKNDSDNLKCSTSS